MKEYLEGVKRLARKVEFDLPEAPDSNVFVAKLYEFVTEKYLSNPEESSPPEFVLEFVEEAEGILEDAFDETSKLSDGNWGTRFPSPPLQL